MKAKFLQKCISAAIMSIGLVTAAFADMVTFDIQASGVSFDNQATATGFITINTAFLPSTGPFSFGGLAPVVQNLQLTVNGAANGGNGTFGLSDFNSIVFSTPSTLDFSQQLIGQILANGCTYGTSTGACGNGNGGDFNLFGTSSPTPFGSYYFRLTAGNDNLLITSLAPEAAVPEPTTVALLGLGILGLAASRRASAKSRKA